ncbi:uncharacterized protein LOC124273183 [Haliotis rubra]|uniref:uncharacterized protein LOC124273183 n=1 Tax=Haliotis rubra TaxID=36100 RepID=UPI001EE58812|nr:uncharacterized protein LOC124273183 [Haliotis rubra]
MPYCTFKRLSCCFSAWCSSLDDLTRTGRREFSLLEIRSHDVTCFAGNTHHVTPVCPAAPPRVRKADVTNGSRVLGSVRTYTCHRGHLDTSAELTSAQTTCLHNSSWSFTSLKCSGPWIRESTPSRKKPKTKWLNRRILRQVTFADTMVFLVKTCNDADLTLDSNVRRYKYNPNVIVGGFNNTTSVIRLCDSRHHLETAILTCSHFRPFWISWKGRLVAVGKGTQVGRGEFMRCYLMKYQRFRKIGISTFINNPGAWLFKKRR